MLLKLFHSFIERRIEIEKSLSIFAAELVIRKGKGNFPASIYLFKVNNRNTRKRREIYSKLTIQIPGRCH